MPVLRFSRVALIALSLTLLLAGCTSGNGHSSLTGGVVTTSAAPSPATDPSTTSPPLTAASMVLSADGLRPLSFGTQAAHALSALTQALGHAETVTRVTPGSTCGATRTFRWKNLDVFVNEVGPGSGALAGIVGWSLGAPAPASLDLRTDRGIGVGSTVAAVKAAYGASVSLVRAAPGAVVKITAPSGVITGQADGLGDANKVQSLRAGVFCGA